MPRDGGFADQTARLQALIGGGGNISYEPHALIQMRARNIFRQDVRATLAKGTVIGQEIIYDNEERWRVKGRDIDGFPLIVVVEAIQDGALTVVVITAFEPNKK